MAFIKRVSTQSQLLQRALMACLGLSIVLPGAIATQTLSASAEASSSSANRPVLADGIYLFGESPSRDQIGATYAVLSVQNNQVEGAFYQPMSSFDCFSGQVLPNRLDVSVVNSYEQVAYPYQVALTVDDSLTAGEAAGEYTLQGFHRIENLSAQDQEILATCQSDLAQ
jgi:hypothetical protein